MNGARSNVLLIPRCTHLRRGGRIRMSRLSHHNCRSAAFGRKCEDGPVLKTEVKAIVIRCAASRADLHYDFVGKGAFRVRDIISEAWQSREPGELSHTSAAPAAKTNIGGVHASAAATNPFGLRRQGRPGSAGRSRHRLRCHVQTTPSAKSGILRKRCRAAGTREHVRRLAGTHQRK